MLKIWFRGAVVSAALWIAAGMAAARPASAYMIEMLTVTLPYSVSVGEATLPAANTPFVPTTWAAPLRS